MKYLETIFAIVPMAFGFASTSVQAGDDADEIFLCTDADGNDNACPIFGEQEVDELNQPVDDENGGGSSDVEVGGDKVAASTEAGPRESSGS